MKITISKDVLPMNWVSVLPAALYSSFMKNHRSNHAQRKKNTGSKGELVEGMLTCTCSSCSGLLNYICELERTSLHTFYSPSLNGKEKKNVVPGYIRY